MQNVFRSMGDDPKFEQRIALIRGEGVRNYDLHHPARATRSSRMFGPTCICKAAPSATEPDLHRDRPRATRGSAFAHAALRVSRLRHEAKTAFRRVFEPKADFAAQPETVGIILDESLRHDGNRIRDRCPARPCPSQLSHQRLERIAFFLL